MLTDLSRGRPNRRDLSRSSSSSLLLLESKIRSNSSESARESAYRLNRSRRPVRKYTAGCRSLARVGQADSGGGVRDSLFRRGLGMVGAETREGMMPAGGTWRRGYTKRIPRSIAIVKNAKDCSPCSDSNVSIGKYLQYTLIALLGMGLVNSRDYA